MPDPQGVPQRLVAYRAQGRAGYRLAVLNRPLGAPGKAGASGPAAPAPGQPPASVEEITRDLPGWSPRRPGQ